MYLWMPPFVDPAGHTGAVIFNDEFDGRLYIDGELAAQGPDPAYLSGGVPSERHDYKLVYTTFRQNAFWQRTTRNETIWEFASETPADHENLPLMAVDYDLALSKTNTAKRGAYTFGVHFRMPQNVAGRSPQAGEGRDLVGRWRDVEQGDCPAHEREQ